MSGKNQQITNTLNADRQAAVSRTNQAWGKAFEPSSYEKRFEQESGDFSNWMKAGDYSKGPAGSFLNFQLAQPARVQQQTERMANLGGVGAAGLAGGDNSIAVQQSRQRQASEAAQNAGEAYEGAVGDLDRFYKGANLNYMNASNAKYGNLFGQSLAGQNAVTNSWVGQMNQPSTFQKIMGGLLQAGGTAAQLFMGGA